jgi:uncharacterized protein YceH (UPF0502 family)
MTMSDPGSPAAAPAWQPIDARQRRVLGVLIEKAKTTPAGYPMSVNAIVTGCNQKNNREPAMALDDIEVEKALDRLRIQRAVSELDWLGRVSKFKHHAYEWMGVSKAELAVMAELLLRGAQSMGDLRSRAARMESIADLAALKPIVDGLIERGLMVALSAPGRGQMVTHALYTPQEFAELKAGLAGHAPGATSFDRDGQVPVSSSMGTDTADPSTPPPRTPAGRNPAGGTMEAAAALAVEVAALRDEVTSLRARVDDLEARLIAALG